MNNEPKIVYEFLGEFVEAMLDRPTLAFMRLLLVVR